MHCLLAELAGALMCTEIHVYTVTLDRTAAVLRGVDVVADPDPCAEGDHVCVYRDRHALHGRVSACRARVYHITPLPAADGARTISREYELSQILVYAVCVSVLWNPLNYHRNCWN